MTWQIILLEPVEAWFLEFAKNDAETADQIEAAIDMLAARGPMLGRPLVDTISHSDLSNLKELRPGSRGGTEIRLLFVFDPDREAIILVAGDKAGAWSTWYKEAIPVAETRYAQYLKEKEARR